MKYTLLALILAGSLFGCAKAPDESKPEAKQEEPVKQEELKNQEPAAHLTVDDELNALGRAESRATKICYNGQTGDKNSDSFFVFWPYLDDEHFDGWYYIDQVDFYQAANKTWYVAEQNSERYVHIFPKIDGLTCKNQ